MQKLFTVLQLVHGRRAERPRRLILDEAHRIRETSRQPLDQSRAPHRPAADRGAARGRPGAGLPARRAPGRPAGRAWAPSRTSSRARRRAGTLRSSASTWTPSSVAAAREEYVLWVKRLLDLEPGGPIDVDRRPALRGPGGRLARRDGAHLADQAGDGYSARMAAGYCWPWSDPRPDGSLVPDVADRRLAPPVEPQGRPLGRRRPAAALWATDPAGFGQVGCVYTAQGFEYDYAGVILGPDLVWRDGPLVARSARPTGPGLPQPDQGQRPGRSTAWSATSTRCCSPAACAA